jgi:hypothetical protein
MVLSSSLILKDPQGSQARKLGIHTVIPDLPNKSHSCQGLIQTERKYMVGLGQESSIHSHAMQYNAAREESKENKARALFDQYDVKHVT